MSSPIVPRVGPRRFQWNAGGWFGASLGSSAWMLIVSCFLIYHEQMALALAPLVGFVVVLSAAIWLWARRSRIYPFPALMALFGLIAIVLPVVWAVVSLSATDDALSAMNWPRAIWPFVVVAAIAPILMLWFFFVERSTGPSEDSRSPNEPNNVA